MKVNESSYECAEGYIGEALENDAFFFGTKEKKTRGRLLPMPRTFFFFKVFFFGGGLRFPMASVWMVLDGV